jgi:hypothetical protein
MNTKKIRTRVTTVTCPQCKEELYSRAHHDFRSCSCGFTQVDGGFEYMRVCWKSGERPLRRIRYIPFTRQQCDDDYNLRIDKLGFIKKD